MEKTTFELLVNKRYASRIPMLQTKEPNELVDKAVHTLLASHARKICKTLIAAPPNKRATKLKDLDILLKNYNSEVTKDCPASK